MFAFAFFFVTLYAILSKPGNYPIDRLDLSIFNKQKIRTFNIEVVQNYFKFEEVLAKFSKYS